MIQSIFSAKRSVYAVLFALLLITGLFTGCASDNIHMPDPEEDVVEVYNGSLTTSIPEMPDFVPVVSNDHVNLVWNNEAHTSANVKLGAFHVDVDMMGFSFLIGEMDIQNVECRRADDGTVTLVKDHFECQAGDYYTKGSLTGKYAKGRLEVTILYKPGSMPFECKSVFEGTSAD